MLVRAVQSCTERPSVMVKSSALWSLSVGSPTLVRRIRQRGLYGPVATQEKLPVSGAAKARTSGKLAPPSRESSIRIPCGRVIPCRFQAILTGLPMR